MTEVDVIMAPESQLIERWKYLGSVLDLGPAEDSPMKQGVLAERRTIALEMAIRRQAQDRRRLDHA